MEYKTCTDCGENKPLTKEFFHGNGYKFRANCKDCVNSRRRANRKAKDITNKRRRERYKNDPEYKRKFNSNRLKNRFGIDLDDYDIILNKQKGRCKICNKHHSEFKKRFAVDHCHETEKKTGKVLVRGLLCGNCNKGIGNLQEDINVLENAIKYLKESQRLKVEINKGD